LQLLTLLANVQKPRRFFSIHPVAARIFTHPALPDVPVVRVVADNLTQHMTEYVVWRVLDHHRQGFLYRAQQKRKVWHEPPQRPASDVAVGIMGLGNLGRGAAKALLALGFVVDGWSRTGQAMARV